MDTTGYECPACGHQVELLSTTNDLKWYCPTCDKRFAECMVNGKRLR